MQWVIAGLGNPGEEYKGTRHNAGRDLLAAIAKKHGAAEWKEDKKLQGQSAKAEFEGVKTALVLPDVYMNNSGKSLRPLVASPKDAKKLIVIHDELDLPLGTLKLSFGAGAGGHKGVESIQTALRTRDFTRIRVGISPATASGKLRKPDSSEIVDFVLGKFKPGEQEKLKKVRALVEEAVELILAEGIEHAMTRMNAR